MSSFGERLKRVREAKGWSQERVGFELEVTKATVSKWETGRAEPSLDNLAKIHRLFHGVGATLDHLVVGADEEAEGLRVGDQQGIYALPHVRAESEDEASLLIRFRELKSRQRKGLLDLLGCA
ncbi:helix-turn-helix transcriptional regulator [Pseudoxanthomonas sp. LjRoot143]|uniref:helix-turn-helix domain-containing protein n=1 Tax=Pseudoxanthomonas sp. LjRoot143 TaxID=3342266 RepID=UPI003ECF9777